MKTKVLMMLAIGIGIVTNNVSFNPAQNLLKGQKNVKVERSYEATDDFVFSDEAYATSTSSIVDKKLNLINNDF
jgi:hypothetical protein